MGISKIKYNNKILALAFCLLISSALSLISCSDQNKIDEDKFIKIYTDLVIAKDTSNIKTAGLKTIIFKKYNVTSTDYENTLKYYNEDPKRWEEFFKKTIDYVQQIRGKND